MTLTAAKDPIATGRSARPPKGIQTGWPRTHDAHVIDIDPQTARHQPRTRPVPKAASPAPETIVADIEMPRMDGLFLTKNIKQRDRLKHVPVIVFSSLVSDDNLKKCRSVGADIQLTKPELPSLVNVVDELMAQRVPA